MGRLHRWRTWVVLFGFCWGAMLGYAALEASRPEAGAPDDVEPTELSIKLLPRLKPTPGVAVFMELEGDSVEGMRALAMAPRGMGVSGAASVQHLLVKDRRGMLHTSVDPASGRMSFHRPVRGRRLTASYLVESPEHPTRYDVQVDETGVRAIGYGMLALPPGRLPLNVSFEWQLRAVDVERAVTSFGAGNRLELTATPFDLAHSFYLAGPLEVHEGEGGRRLVIWGDTALDPATTLGFCSEMLSAAQQLFEPHTFPVSHTFLFFGEPNMGERNAGLAFHRSFGVWMDDERELDTRMQLMVAHEIVHRWIGGTIRLLDEDGSDIEWFSEGLSVHYARTLMWRAGLLSAEAFLEDVERDLLAQQALLSPARQSRHPSRPDPQLAARSHASPSYHRGALYAARVDGLLRMRGHLGLDALVVQLMAEAAASPEGLSKSAWREAVVAALGPEAGYELDALIGDDVQPIELPDAAFGPCFERRRSPEGGGRASWRPSARPGCAQH